MIQCKAQRVSRGRIDIYCVAPYKNCLKKNEIQYYKWFYYFAWGYITEYI